MLHLFRMQNTKVKKIVDFLEDKKIYEIKVFEHEGESIIIASALSRIHNTTVVENLQVYGKKEGWKIYCDKHEEWSILDAHDVIIHIFIPESRNFYCIDDIYE